MPSRAAARASARRYEASTPAVLNDRARTRSRLVGTGAPGLERAAVFLRRRAFAPHRHDTYAIGVTTAGVQRFRYRGARRDVPAGTAARAAPRRGARRRARTEDGFGYRIVYVDPALVQAALGGAPLPFVADPVLPRGVAADGVLQLLDDIDEPLDELARDDGADGGGRPARLAAGGRGGRAALDLRAVAAVATTSPRTPTAPTPASSSSASPASTAGRSLGTSGVPSERAPTATAPAAPRVARRAIARATRSHAPRRRPASPTRAT